MQEPRAAAQARVARAAASGRVNVATKSGRPAQEKVVATFSELTPNATTIEAMREGRRKEGLSRYASVQALFDGLHADD